MAHKWREAGRFPVTLVRRVCDCGCKKQMIQLVANDGRVLSFNLGALGKHKKAMVRAGQALTLAQELAGIWQRVRSVL
jgi:hypothetical protein